MPPALIDGPEKTALMGNDQFHNPRWPQPGWPATPAAPPDDRVRSAEHSLRHSRLGIAAVAVAVVTGIFDFMLLVCAGIAEARNKGGFDENSPLAIAMGLLL